MKLLFKNWRSFVNESKEISDNEIEKLKKIKSELENASKMHKGQADRIGAIISDLLNEQDITEEEITEILAGLNGDDALEEGTNTDPQDLQEAVSIFLEMKDEALEEKRKRSRRKTKAKRSRKKSSKKSKPKDACYHKVKARYDVWPSAYASGALVKCRKVGASNWGTGGKKKNESKELTNFNRHTGRPQTEKGRELAPKKRFLDAEEKQKLDKLISIYGSYANIPRQFKSQFKENLEQIVQEEIESVLNEKCWPGYEKKGMKTMFGKRYPNCVKKTNEDVEENVDLDEEIELDEEDLDKWFKGGGWKQAGGKYDGKPCARQPGQKTTPKCVSRSKFSNMSPEDREAAGRKKRKQDPGQPKKTGAAKPTYVKTDPEKKRKKK